MKRNLNDLISFVSVAREGSFTPPARSLLVRLRRVDHAPTAVRLDGASLDARADEAALLAAGSGCFWDDRDLALVALFPDHPRRRVARGRTTRPRRPSR